LFFADCLLVGVSPVILGFDYYFLGYRSLFGDAANESFIMGFSLTGLKATTCVYSYTSGVASLFSILLKSFCALLFFF